ncbi:DUF924 family protein [Coralloluteibacterium stylophorae]|uniref:DUF924 domain-containing protein n=1 Tax=Coralloluteibacterium stylophorae TaxID=1776034 RepID=A0A8J7VSV9_9GAMM|nr:DUF924 family protein [Coralloluteibacterium stylophorae]MBS7458006.1 DUF924 domain-containing protein [Coralloluteibacterium stylophorae]
MSAATGDAGDSAAQEELLGFWFGAREEWQDGLPPEPLRRRWFAPEPMFDAEIDRRFGALVLRALHGRLDAWCATPRGWLALILLLDQCPRNIYRGDPRAWVGDPRAQALALGGIAHGSDRLLAPIERAFVYLPLEHAEDPALQVRSVALFEALVGDAAPAARGVFEDMADYARRHREVIERFGRFPHRNAVLGRADAAGERAWLDAGGGF